MQNLFPSNFMSSRIWISSWNTLTWSGKASFYSATLLSLYVERLLFKQGCIFCTTLIFPLLQFFSLLVYTSKEGEKWKNIFWYLYFFISPLPPTYFFSFFFIKEGRKMEKMFTVLLIFTLFPHSHIFFPLCPLAVSNLQNIQPCI